MSACTFFGHRDCPGWVRPQLRAALEYLMESCRVKEFYLGNHGAFDAMALSLLRELEGRYPDLRYTVVLAYMPGEGEGGTLGAETIFPEGLETAPPRFAVCRRNQWMIGHSEYVVTYVTRSYGGAARFEREAQRAGKKVIRLGRG